MSLLDKTHLTWSNLRESINLPEATFPNDPEDALPAADASGSIPLGISILEPTVLVTCVTCRRSVLQVAFSDHMSVCKHSAPQEPAPKPVAPAAKPIKKRKLAAPTPAPDAPAEKPEVPAEKPVERPAKMPKHAPRPVNKGLIDLDKHCAVRTENGTLCMRSITCKIHGVGQKRKVQGRSQLYDVLISEHQQRRPDRPLKRFEGASAPANRTPGLLRANSTNLVGFGLGDTPSKPLTRDEEADLVVNAIRLHQPTPLAPPRGPSTVEVLLAIKQRRALENAFAGRPA
ncbi:SCA7, zinc-binding domain-containing protein [Powellomyces hirtus]|nr:SCA7, zinc-binding domain-containing protein [Powellomyces hirtus]